VGFLCRKNLNCIEWIKKLWRFFELNNQDNAQTNPSLPKGYLRFLVRTASGAIPLEGALVTIRERGNKTDAIVSFITDQSGGVPLIALPAPPRLSGDRPSDALPYASYDAEVSMPGYYSNLYSGIVIFDSITSVQTADLIPLPESGTFDDYARDGVFIFDSTTGERLRGEADE
jgi:hypothetical protein